MSAYSPGGLVDVLKIKRTELIGDAKAIIAAIFETETDPDDPIKSEDEETIGDWWQHYGFLSRPPDGSQSLVLRLGTQAFVIASRALTTAGVWGQMKAGDVALYSTGKNVIRLNAAGSISMLVPSKGKQILLQMHPDGAFKVLLGNGFYLELSEENGFVVNTPGKDTTIAGMNVNVNANAFNNNSPTIKLNIAASKPLTPATAANPGVFV